uniref:Uncharacterized protein n=1 Tax=Rhizophora mucronata TaxID=61149 RepID=A0A2P2QDU3_RHIMU
MINQKVNYISLVLSSSVIEKVDKVEFCHIRRNKLCQNFT